MLIELHYAKIYRLKVWLILNQHIQNYPPDIQYVFSEDESDGESEYLRELYALQKPFNALARWAELFPYQPRMCFPRTTPFISPSADPSLPDDRQIVRSRKAYFLVP